MSGWIETDRNLLRTMWACGASSQDIASSLIKPVSRNAVMGMVNRLGLMGLGHADPARILSMSRVADVMCEPFSLGSPLHREALLTLTSIHLRSRSVDALAVGSGICRLDCTEFVGRLPLVWPARAGVPTRWMGGLEGNLAFILDMAVIAGSLPATPVRGQRSVSSPAFAMPPMRPVAEACPAT